MNKTGIPYLDMTWNAFGFGCSKKCEGCWAKRMAPRIGKVIGCPRCAAFEPHFHPERLDEPLKRKKREVIGVQFTGDLFDRAHDRANIYRCVQTMQAAKWHQYVILTQQFKHLAELALPYAFLQRENIYWGVTIRNQAEADEGIAALLASGAKNCWVSYEPAAGPVDFADYLPIWEYCYDDPVTGEICHYANPTNCAGEYIEKIDDGPHISAVIVGCDNRSKVPFKLQWAERVVDDCQAAAIPVYVKQIRLSDGEPLLTDPADFPEPLQIRQLPWRKE